MTVGMLTPASSPGALVPGLVSYPAQEMGSHPLLALPLRKVSTTVIKAQTMVAAAPR
jgi:hypothetical protein